MNELSLFTGAGGGILGSLLLGWRTIGYVEIEDYCQRVLRQRIDDGILHDAPIFGDIRAFISEGYAEAYSGMVDVVTGGFPCQPFSVAGKQLGESDSRNMWPATIEAIRRVKPRWCLLENVPGLLAARDGAGRPYFGRILGDLAESGYDVRWKVISAGELGAPHRRDRIWMLATNSNVERWNAEINQEALRNYFRGSLQNPWKEIADSRNGNVKRLLLDCFQQASSSGFIGMDDGLPSELDEYFSAIGNGQVPAVVRAAWELLNHA
jgi:DNA (cytosine-5)-methyltransferase 1